MKRSDFEFNKDMAVAFYNGNKPQPQSFDDKWREQVNRRILVAEKVYKTDLKHLIT